MSRAMIQAAVTMGQLQNKLDVIGNNLANSQTNGYKTKQTEFSSMLVQQIDHLQHASRTDGRMTPDGIRVGTGARLGSIHQNDTVGALRETDRGLDLALNDANHYFQVEVDEGGVTETRFTRDGAFYLQPVNNDTAVMLTNASGNPIVGVNGPIVLANGFDALEITEEGTIITRRNQVEQVEGQISTVAIERSRMLEDTGQNMLRIPDGVANADGLIQPLIGNEANITVGALEQSNVDLASEMSELLNAQRSYQYNARTISMGDQMNGLINQLR